MRIPGHRSLLIAVLIALPTLASAQDEDAAHRADRLETQSLNTQVQQRVAARDAANQAKFDRYRAASADYNRALAAWRERTATCENGDWSACQTR